MVDFYLIAYYEIDMKWYYGVLADGKNMKKNECAGTDTHDLAKTIKWERDIINLDIPVGYINMVPDHEKNPNAKRLSTIHERTLMQKLFEE